MCEGSSNSEGTRGQQPPNGNTKEKAGGGTQPSIDIVNTYYTTYYWLLATGYILMTDDY